MKKLIDYIHEAEIQKKAIGHFNVSNLEQLRAIEGAVKKLNTPVIIGVSEGERDFIGVPEIVSLVRTLREKENLPVFLNADHTHSLGKVLEAAEAGFDAIIFDGSKLPFRENIAQTKRAVELIDRIDSDILVEGELGYIGSGSEILEKIPEGAAIDQVNFTKPEEALQFVNETGIDLFSPAVGNIHGMLAHARNPHLDILRIEKIREVIKVPLVLHGGSGVSDEDFVSAINAGISIIHISTEIRAAWKEGLTETLKENPKEVAPYKLLEESVQRVEGVIVQRLKLFNKAQQ